MPGDAYDDAFWARMYAKSVVKDVAASVMGDNALNAEDVEDLAGATWLRMFESTRYREYRMNTVELRERGEVVVTYTSRKREVTRRYTDLQEFMEDSLKGLVWLYAKRVLFDWLQERNRRDRWMATEALGWARAMAVFLPDPETTAVNHVASQEAIREVREMVLGWPPIEQLVFELLFLRKIGHDEARQRLGARSNKVTALVHHVHAEISTLCPEPDPMDDLDTRREYTVAMNLQGTTASDP